MMRLGLSHDRDSLTTFKRRRLWQIFEASPGHTHHLESGLPNLRATGAALPSQGSSDIATRNYHRSKHCWLQTALEIKIAEFQAYQLASRAADWEWQEQLST